MPMFCWTALASNLLIVAAFPILTATLAMLIARPLPRLPFLHQRGRRQRDDVHEPDLGLGPSRRSTSWCCRRSASSPRWSRPSPASRCSATARWCWRRMAICVISFMVWLHHFFTMGAGADVNAVFGIATMIIAVPTGVKIFNWLFTMYGGRVRFATPMLWSIGFMVTFVIGGMTGVLLAVPPADFVLHNSLFLVAHFHNVIIGGVLFGAFAGYHLLVSEGVRLPAARRAGQGGVLVLVRRLLRRLHAALCRSACWA